MSDFSSLISRSQSGLPARNRLASFASCLREATLPPLEPKSRSECENGMAVGIVAAVTAHRKRERAVSMSTTRAIV